MPSDIIINGPMDTQVLSLMGLWTSMEMFGQPLMDTQLSLMGLWTPMDMFG